MAQEILNVSQLKVGVEDKEILHGCRIHILIVGILVLAEYKRLVCVAEGLGKHGHNHSYLTGCTVYAQLHQSFVTVVEKEGIYHLVDGLVKNTYQPEYQDRE